MKHFESDFHFTKDLVMDHKLEVKYMPIEKQVTDLFTKPSIKHAFHSLKTKLMVLPQP